MRGAKCHANEGVRADAEPGRGTVLLPRPLPGRRGRCMQLLQRGQSRARQGGPLQGGSAAMWSDDSAARGERLRLGPRTCGQ